jgi:hypothetical protein
MEPNDSIRRRGVYLLPNLLTSAALFAAFYSIISGINGKFEIAAIAIIVAGFLDGMDGLTGDVQAIGQLLLGHAVGQEPMPLQMADDFVSRLHERQCIVNYTLCLVYFTYHRMRSKPNRPNTRVRMSRSRSVPW